MNMDLNYGRIALSGLGALVAYLAVGFTLFAALRLEQVAKPWAAIYRPPEQMKSVMPIGMVAMLVAMFALAALYAMGFSAESSLLHGVCFGALVGTVVAGSFILHNATINVGMKLVILQAVANLVQWTAAGVAIALIYRA